MKFLLIMGACFFVAGAAVLMLAPVLRVMGGVWVGVGLLLMSYGYVAAKGEAHRQALLQSGKPGRATVLEVQDTGVTVNNNPRVRVKVRIEVPNESPVEGTRAMMVSRLSVPQIGEVYEVRFDPQNPNDFVFAPSSSQTSSQASTWTPPSARNDTISQLERLEALREKGALTDEEFDAQKKKLLG